jgi:hypothetical protein
LRENEIQPPLLAEDEQAEKEEPEASHDHSSITSISRKKCLRPTSIVRLLSRISAVLIHKIGGNAIGRESTIQVLLVLTWHDLAT